jgi:hypothetical protein
MRGGLWHKPTGAQLLIEKLRGAPGRFQKLAREAVNHSNSEEVAPLVGVRKAVC